MAFQVISLGEDTFAFCVGWGPKMGTGTGFFLVGFWDMKVADDKEQTSKPFTRVHQGMGGFTIDLLGESVCGFLHCGSLSST